MKQLNEIDRVNIFLNQILDNRKVSIIIFIA